jgi:hypothetical protein
MGVFIRDIGCYIFSTLIVIGFGIYGELNLFAGGLLLSIYVMLVVYIAIDEFVKKRRYPFMNPVEVRKPKIKY